MKHYDDYLAQLPFGPAYELNRSCIRQHPLFISFDDDESWHVAYFKIVDREACAVVISSKEHKYIKLEKEIKGYTLRLVYLFSATEYSDHVYIPETVWSIYGAENWTNMYKSPFVFEDGEDQRLMRGTGSDYFKFVEFDRYDHRYWLCSADGEDVIYGVCDGSIFESIDSRLKGVKTIHSIRQLNSYSAPITSLSIPASVQKIKKLHGHYLNVTFEGGLPVFCAESLNKATFDRVKVLTAFDISPWESVKSLLRMENLSEDKVLFAAHALTQKVPVNKGYIALTNARYECDGETILVNTPWIATICPKSYLRSDGEVKGAVVLIGLMDGRQERGVVYDVYESPDVIEGKIADAITNDNLVTKDRSLIMG